MAVEALQQRVPDLVVMDMVMPRIGGLEALRRIRAEPRTRCVPVVMISALADDEARAQALEAGASDFLIKPFSAQELAARLATQLELTQRRRAAAEGREEISRAVADHAPVLIWSTGANGRVEHVNERGLEFTGLTREDLTRGAWARAVHPADRPAALDALRGSVQARRPCELEVRLRRRDGEYRWMLVAGAPRFLPDGEFAGLVCSALDITDRKRRDEERREAEGELRAILEGAMDAVVGVDGDDHITFWNARAEALFGWPAREAVGRDMAELAIPHRFRQAHRDVVRELQESGGDRLNHRVEVTARRSDGTEFPAEVTLIALRKGDGTFACTAFLADITERKVAEEDRARLLAGAEQARAQAEEANRTKDEFLATLSHELRTPLNAIVGWVHLLRGGQLDECTTRRALDTIDRNAKIQTQLIADILDVSRIVSGKLRVQMRPVEPAAIVEAAVDTVRPAAEAKAIRIELELHPLAGPVLGDPDRLQQVVWNLLSNAIKFTPDRGAVRVALQRSAASAVLRVSDNGAGIAAEFLPFVFDRFRQADASSTRLQGGLGLGLAIARHLAEVHGGTLIADSAGTGEGALFTLTLPLAPAAEAAAPAPRDLPEAAFTGPSLEGVSVLVVCPDRGGEERTSGALRERGAEVIVASHAAQAVDLVKRLRPDVLLACPNGRGDEEHGVIRAVRDIPPERGGLIPAALLAGSATAEERIDALLAGYQAQIPETAGPPELAAVVASLAGRTRELIG
jgi:PAS domain S-box-containing protein